MGRKPKPPVEDVLEKDALVLSKASLAVPQNGIKILEQDDDKRDFIAKSLSNILEINRAFEAPVQTDEELLQRLEWFYDSCVTTRQLPTVEKMCLAIGWPRETVF